MQDTGESSSMVGDAKVTAWDLPTRLFHWALVVSITFAWITYRYAEVMGDPTMKMHRYNGYFILSLLIFRVIWGFVGHPTARFRNFLRSPSTALGYGGNLLRGRTTPHYLGHNPLGAYMVIALMTVVAAQAVVGLVVVEHNDTAWGPLYRLVPETSQRTVRYIHYVLFFYVLLPLVAIHILTNLAYTLLKKDPLITAMLSGKKPRQEYADASVALPPRRNLLRALSAAFVAIAVVLGTISLLGGRLFY